MPPMTPEPTQSIQSWWRYTPTAEMRSPPHQQIAATTPALRGPACSSQPPQIAEAVPRKTKKSVNIHPSMLIFQSHVVAKIVANADMSAGHATDFVMPTACESGSQNTLNPYAMPMHRWIARAAGGTSHRLNPERAMVRSFASSPTPMTSSPDPTATWFIGTSSFYVLCDILVPKNSMEISSLG